MLEYLSYILFFGLLIIIVIYVYIRFKFGFWVIQPVFHIYDLGYMINPPGIINDFLPERNKYTNFKDIETISRGPYELNNGAIYFGEWTKDGHRYGNGI